ncbi:MAG: stress response translation initiation inhibitor YciH [Candidatus Rokubacteria bacterium]|nr:stress response translation initiation inhibitor YciH [Candidatus Rokubacteria bacterium]
MRDRRLVYSTDQGRIQPHEEARRASPKRPPGVPDDGVVRIFRERGGRGGKVVTVIRGLPERGAELAARAAELKRLCSAGGTVKGEVVELQGDHREPVAERLRALGYTVKLAGG